jgi:peptide/nickel transport system substrate-binding protein
MRLATWTVLASLALWGCDRKPAGAPPEVLIWGRGADSTTLDPGEIEWLEDMKITQSVFETLVGFKAQSTELEGRLAKSWRFSPDGRTATFDLRPGVLFHDGTPFDSEAVVFSFQRVLDPRHPHRPKSVPYATSLAVIQTVEASGPDRVVFRLRHPSPTFLSILTLPAAAIVSPAAVRKSGASFARHPVGTGVYRVAGWDPDVRMVLDYFPGYWGAKPSFPRVIVATVASPQTAVQKLRKGELHVVDHPSLADISGLQKDPRTKVRIGPSLNTCYLGFNLKRHPYSDRNFREAVSLALDRKALIGLAYHDLAEPAANLVPPELWKEIGPAREYEADLGKARECLGRVKPDCGEVELLHMTFPRPYIVEPVRVAEFVKDRLRKIGLSVKLTGYDKSAYTLKIKEESHPMYLYGWLADYADPDNFYYPLLHGDNAGDLNGSFFNDPAFNDAVVGARSEMDPEKRRFFYRQAYSRYQEELPTIPLVHVFQVVALSKFVDYRVHPIETRFFQVYPAR